MTYLSSFWAASSFQVGFSCRGAGLRAAQSRLFRCWFSLRSFLFCSISRLKQPDLPLSFLGQQSVLPICFPLRVFLPQGPFAHRIPARVLSGRFLRVSSTLFGPEFSISGSAHFLLLWFIRH
jgi:hypothetical protein